MKTNVISSIICLLGLVGNLNNSTVAQTSQQDLDKTRTETLKKLEDFDFQKFARENNVTLSQDVARRFNEQLEFVMKINRNTAFSFVADMNWLAALDPEQRTALSSIHLSETQLPRFKNTTWNYNYVDYRNQEIVTPVKNQGLCASDYAFAGLAALESAYVSKTGDNKILSEQEIIDCSYGMYDDGRMNQGCTQGLPQYALEYANKYALSAAGDYPYVGKQQVCKVKTPTIEGQFKYQQLLADNEDHLAYLLEKNGPVIVYVCDGPSFGLYSWGIFNDAAGCDCRANRAVLVVGLQQVNDKESWIIKNSWGNNWGEEGFFRLEKGLNMCNLITNNVTLVAFGKDPILG